MKTWRVELTAEGKCSAKAKIQRGIFQKDALSPLLFIIAMVTHNRILTKSHLMYMDVIKLSAKCKGIGNSNTRSENIQSGHRDGIWHRKCAMLKMKSRKSGMELPNQEKLELSEKRKPTNT